jgi:outer membrane protein TolC
MQAQAFVAESQLLVTRAETAVSVNEQQLRTSMHAPPDEQLTVGEDVMRPFAYSQESSDLQLLYAEAVKKRLEIRSLDQTQYSFSQAAEVQNTYRYPRLEAFGNLTYANPNQRVFPLEEKWRGSWDVGVQVVWSVNDFWIADADTRKLDTQRAQLIAQRRSIEDALRLEILTAERALREARIAVTTAEQGHAAAQAALEARERLHAGGRATSFELIQAETARLQARLNLVEAHIALRVARVQLDHALGRDVSTLTRLK